MENSHENEFENTHKIIIINIVIQLIQLTGFISFLSAEF